MTEPDPLRALVAEPPLIDGWADAPGMRRTVRRRRSRRAVAAATVVTTAAAAAVAGLVLTSGGQAPARPAGPLVVLAGEHVGSRVPGAVQLVSDATADVPVSAAAGSAVSRAEQGFGLRLLRTAAAESPSSTNLTLSPLSLYLLLGMVQTGARGSTATRIAQTLGSSDLSTGQQNVGLATLEHTLSTTARQDGITLASANSLWIQRGLPVGGRFLSDLSRFYDNGVWQTDFTKPAAERAINAWAAQHTRGKITKLFDQLDRSTLAVLANAVYFHAAWRTPFDPTGTEPGHFTTATGRRVSAQFMSGGRDIATAQTADYSAAQVPYADGRFAAMAVMPRGKSLPSFVSGLSASTLAGITTSVRRAHDAVELPKFTTRSYSELNNPLQAMGMRGVFNAGDFSGINPRLVLSEVAQRDYLQVGEKGTTAAAVSGASFNQSLALHVGRTIVFDHPFLFLIRDTVTGAILFTSEINDPRA